MMLECRACSGDGFLAATADTAAHERITRDSRKCTYCNGKGYSAAETIPARGKPDSSVYTAGPDGRCTGCQRHEAEHAPEAWTADARACPPVEATVVVDLTTPIALTAEAWDAVVERIDNPRPPTNAMLALVDHDDGACPEVTAETVTDVDVFQATRDRELGEPLGKYLRNQKAARARINARAKGGAM